MSAIGGKADVTAWPLQCPLIARSGHRVATGLDVNWHDGMGPFGYRLRVEFVRDWGALHGVSRNDGWVCIA